VGWRSARLIGGAVFVLVVLGGLATLTARAQHQSRVQLEQRFVLRNTLLQANVGGVEPANDRREPEELRIGDERDRYVILSGRRLDLGLVGLTSRRASRR
jgi:hypothetical protein